ncbi:phage protein [Escherichia coli EC1848]|nr:phage protein [Escherichia coli EC1848]
MIVASVQMVNIKRQISVSISVRHGLAVQKRRARMAGE